MDGIAEIVNSIVDNARMNSPMAEGDYIGDDGLVYCGKCRTPRQVRMEWIDGHINTLPILCKCRQDAEDKAAAEIKHREDMERIERLKKNSLMDSKFRTCKFDTLNVTTDNKRQIMIARRYAEKFDELFSKNQGLLFYGNVGTGKTHIACCIGNYVMEHMRSVYATSFVKILQQAKSFMTVIDREAFLHRISSASLVILDDLGAERNTDYALELVYDVIDRRYRSGKPMIVTTNLMLSEMQNPSDIRYSRIYDRIFEVCYPVEFTGKSLRMKEAASRFDDMKSLLEG